MAELSIFVDESGDVGNHSDYYLVTLVFHAQNESIGPAVQVYERSLSYAELAPLPFHMDPLLNGHGDYRWQTIAERKRYLTHFSKLVSHLPVSYRSFIYQKRKGSVDKNELAKYLHRDIDTFLISKLEYLNRYDLVKVYYDNGQSIVTKAVHGSVEHAISCKAIAYRDASPRAYRLSQVADYICGIELLALKYAGGIEGKTAHAFFGSERYFRKNYLKQMRRKLFN